MAAIGRSRIRTAGCRTDERERQGANVGQHLADGKHAGRDTDAAAARHQSVRALAPEGLPRRKSPGERGIAPEANAIGACPRLGSMQNTRLTGTLVQENSQCSGLARADNDGVFYFLPASQMSGARLTVGDRLSFEAKPGRRPRAINVRKESSGR
jgi:hypothetical protein